MYEAFEPTTRRTELSLITLDETRLKADFFEPGESPRGTVLVAPAMGVPRKFYRAFNSYLAEAGFAVICPDYRGIGESKPATLQGYQATLQDWADKDLSAAIDYLRMRFPDVPLTWIGHSVGGQLFGWLQNPPVDRALFVAAQSGYWKHWSGLHRLGMRALWHAIPMAVRLNGRLPMSAVGQGEDVPAGVALQWAQWGRHPRYIAGFANARKDSGFESFKGLLRAYAIADDNYAPQRAVQALVSEFQTPRKEVICVRPAELGLRRLGHFGAFRPTARVGLWSEIRDWLLKPMPAVA